MYNTVIVCAFCPQRLDNGKRRRNLPRRITVIFPDIGGLLVKMTRSSSTKDKLCRGRIALLHYRLWEVIRLELYLKRGL